MPQINKQWSRMSQEEREAALLAQAAEHRQNHPAGRRRDVEFKDEEFENAEKTYTRKRRKYERRQENTEARDSRPGAGILTLGWMFALIGAQIPVPIIALTLYALAIYNVVRVLRAGRIGKVGKFFSWMLVIQVGYSLVVGTLMAWPVLSHLFFALTLPNPTIG
jgi:hypothetical protein